MDLPEHLVDVEAVAFLPPALLLLVSLGNGLLGLACLLGGLSGSLGGHVVSGVSATRVWGAPVEFPLYNGRRGSGSSVSGGCSSLIGRNGLARVEADPERVYIKARLSGRTLTKTQMKKLQGVQNQALRYAYNERYPYTHTSVELHRMANLLPLNIRLHQRAQKTWDKLERMEDANYQQLIDNLPDVDHGWIPSSLRLSQQDDPEGIYLA